MVWADFKKKNQNDYVKKCRYVYISYVSGMFNIVTIFTKSKKSLKYSATVPTR